MPEDTPLVLIGQNNAGKTNILAALNLILGERSTWNYRPEANEHFGRTRDNRIVIEVDVDGMVATPRRGGQRPVGTVQWSHPPAEDSFAFRAFEPTGDLIFGFNDDCRHQCICVLIEADRRLGWELTYRSQFTLLSRLMHRFHEALQADETRMDELEAVFGRTREIFGELPEFSTFTTSLQENLTALASGMEYGLEVDFSAYDPRNFFHALQVQAKQGDVVRSLDELGTGQEQLLALALVQAYAEAFHGQAGIVLAMEEPESHLHPLQQQWLSMRAYEIAAAGIQTVITTHSPAFLDVENLAGTVLVRKQDGRTTVTQITERDLAAFCYRNGAPSAHPDTILSFYKAAATSEILAGMFANRVVLVEGPTEAFALPILLGRIGLPTVRDGTAVIAVHGVGNLAKWWRFFSAFGIPAYPVFDNDSGEDKTGRRRMDLLSTLRIPDEDQPTILETAEMLVTEHFTVFGRNFEECVRDLAPDWAALEESAHAAGLTASKPLVARFAAAQVEMTPGTALRRNLEDLARAITATAAPPSA